MSVAIIPAILPASWRDLEEHCQLLRGVVRHVQIDVVDGHFAKHKTWPYRDGETFKKIVEEEHGLPFWEELDFEFDLMVGDPAAVVGDYARAGASRIIVHAAAQSAEAAVQKLVDLNGDSGAWSVGIGVALNAHAQPEDLEKFEEQYDFVQVMGIERIGRQGEPLSQQALYLLERLRHRYPKLPLQVDGGVRLENARRLIAAGAQSLVAGSALFEADDVGEAYKALYNTVNGG